jgi:tetratricopeptide (TPR) repeat protein
MKLYFSPLLLSIILVLAGGVFVLVSNSSTLWHNNQTDTAESISKAEALVATKPARTQPYIALSSLYLQKIRETSDSTFYTKIDALMDVATTIDPHDADVPAIRASVAMGRHDFKTAYDHIREALALNSSRGAYYGLKGDAEIELGKYDGAVKSFQTMVNLRPDFSSWTRIAYIRELYGDIAGARIALNTAISSGSNYPENIAWAYVELSKLDIRNDTSRALVDLQMAQKTFPLYSQAMEGLGKTEYARGDMLQAENYFKSAYATLPLAQYAIDLADIAFVRGDKATSEQYIALAQVAFRASRRAGVNTDLEESLFLSDHGMSLLDALAKAERAYSERPSIYGADYLAWALYKNGMTEQATHYTAQALRLGLTDPLILYHQGVIASVAGDIKSAKKYLKKAYEINPHFSIEYAADLAERVQSFK